jgi:hypothetical protein
VLITASTHERLDEAIEVEARGHAQRARTSLVELFAPVVGAADPLAAGPVSGGPR